MKKQRKYNEDEIREKYEKLSSRRKVEVLEEALGHMHAANWLTETDCIAMGMGYERDLENSGLFYKANSTSKA